MIVPRRFGWRFWGIGGALWVQLLKSLVRTLSGQFDETTSQKRVAMTAVIHSKSERIDVRATMPVKKLLQEAAC